MILKCRKCFNSEL